MPSTIDTAPKFEPPVVDVALRHYTLLAHAGEVARFDV
jgi:hypothetical protein